MTRPEDLERHALRLSVFGSLLMSALGFGFSIATGSEAILLDGVFSTINAVVGLVTLRVAALVQRPDDTRFHFGYASFEPLTNTIKGLIILLVCSFALASALVTLRAGGRTMEMGLGLAYAIVAGLGCFVVAWVQRRAATRAGSPLVEVEARNWTVDGMMSSAVAGAFGISLLIRGTAYSGWLPYVDPLVVAALSVVSLGVPIGIIRRNLAELLLAAPPVEVRHSLEERVHAIARDLPTDRTVIRTIKIGRQHYALVHLLVTAGTEVGSIEDLDGVRQKIVAELAEIEPTWIVDVIFTANDAWV